MSSIFCRTIRSDKRVVVLSGRSLAPREIAAKLEAGGVKHLYVDGGMLIGEGIPLFGTLAKDVRLRAVATRQYDSGLVQTECVVETN